MANNKNNSALAGLFQTFFGKHWPVWVGGVTLGLLNILLFAIKSPWGASGGLNSWGENFYSLFGSAQVVPVFKSNYGMLVLLIMLGSFVFVEMNNLK